MNTITKREQYVSIREIKRVNSQKITVLIVYLGKTVMLLQRKFLSSAIRCYSAENLVWKLSAYQDDYPAARLLW